jgi:transcriptional regulator with XRE-family HTH domain
MDRAALADFLRRRREALQPGDVGLSAGARRRTRGLRREEVAAIAVMSTDYYTRLEQQRGPQPSEQMLASLARALRLTGSERDYLFQTAGPARRSQRHGPRLADCQALFTEDQSQALLVISAPPSTKDYEKLQQLTAQEDEPISLPDNEAS